MIELLLEAERALSFGRVDRAEQLYQQVAGTDPRNSIAVVGLARVALERADDLGAYLLARRALAIDPENEAAQRLATRLEEVMRTRGDDVPATPDVPGWPSRPSVVPPSMAPKPPDRKAPAPSPPSRQPTGSHAEDPAADARPPTVPRSGADRANAGGPVARPARRSLLDRLRRR